MINSDRTWPFGVPVSANSTEDKLTKRWCGLLYKIIFYGDFHKNSPSLTQFYPRVWVSVKREASTSLSETPFHVRRNLLDNRVSRRWSFYTYPHTSSFHVNLWLRHERCKIFSKGFNEFLFSFIIIKHSGACTR